MKLADFDFDLPPELIAQHPAKERDQARLLVLNRADSSIQHHHFRDIRTFLGPTDALVVNQTKVMPARLKGRRTDSGGQVELLLIRRQEGACWLAMGRPGRRLKPGTVVEIGQDGQLRAEIVERTAEGRFVVRLDGSDVERLLEEVGEVPLPPYIQRQPEPDDSTRYQTVFARQSGAVAAPTAGLHFTRELLKDIGAQGTAVVPVLLHVGPGTFSPVRSEDPRQHRLEAEYYEVAETSAGKICQCRQRGGRLVAVGTTVVRTLETVVGAQGEVQAGNGWSDTFIYPPYQFKVVDALVTNFHLPRSSLLFLVAAFAGYEFTMTAYRQAVDQGYRFYSYGDAMLIL